MKKSLAENCDTTGEHAPRPQRKEHRLARRLTAVAIAALALASCDSGAQTPGVLAGRDFERVPNKLNLFRDTNDPNTFFEGKLDEPNGVLCQFSTETTTVALGKGGGYAKAVLAIETSNGKLTYGEECYESAGKWIEGRSDLHPDPNEIVVAPQRVNSVDVSTPG